MLSVDSKPGFGSLGAVGIKEASFSPYVNNGGTTIAVAGKDFVVIAADTRLSDGYSISSRKVSKLVQLTSKCVLASSGMLADANTLHKMLLARLEMYKHQNNKEMSTTAIAQLLSNTLYYKRFFPYYAFNVLAGIDDDGAGCAFSYDAVGSFQKLGYSSSGTGQTLVQPFLDNQLEGQHQMGIKLVRAELSVQEVEELVRDAFNSAGERDIYTGDFVEVKTITKDGIRTWTFDLKFD